MVPCDIIVVEKEHWSRRVDKEGSLLITVDFIDVCLLYIAVERYGYKNDQFCVIIRNTP